jgi:hypothetical protein
MDGARDARGRVVPLRRGGAQLGHGGRRDPRWGGGGGRWGTRERGQGGRAERAAGVVDDGHGARAGAAAVAEAVMRLDRRVLLTGRDMRGISSPGRC